MTTEEQLKTSQARIKKELGALIKQIARSLQKDNYEDAVENIAILNANVVGLSLIDAVLTEKFQ